MQQNYDYIIAGGGSAGATLAAKLAEKSDASVLLIEGGGSGKSLFTEMPAGNGFILVILLMTGCLRVFLKKG